MASPAIDGHINGQGSGSFATSGGLTTANTNDVICAIVYNEQGTLRTVSSITATGLTFTFQYAYSGADPGRGGRFCSLELWTAPATSALTGKTFSITMSGSFDDGNYVIFGVSGCNDINSPFDGNANSHKTGTGGSEVISTDQANDLIIGAFATSFNNNPGNSPGTGYTLVDVSNNAGGALFSNLGVFRKQVTSTQSSVTVTNGSAGVSQADLVFVLTGDAIAVNATVNLTGQTATSQIDAFHTAAIFSDLVREDLISDTGAATFADTNREVLLSDTGKSFFAGLVREVLLEVPGNQLAVTRMKNKTYIRR